MIIVYKNFFRNRMVNLSKRSVQHFLPNAKFFCISLYKQEPNEYSKHEPLDKDILVTYKPTKWVVTNNKPLDHIDDSKTAGYALPDNARLFSEGLNLVYEEFKHSNEKVLMLAEDHFFTTGATLKELQDNEFDWAYGNWDSDTDVNGSIICFRPQSLSHILPIPDGSGMVETHLQNTVTLRVDPDRRHRISTRNKLDYGGDGIYTNSSETMIRMLTEAGIL